MLSPGVRMLVLLNCPDVSNPHKAIPIGNNDPPACLHTSEPANKANSLALICNFLRCRKIPFFRSTYRRTNHINFSHGL